MDTSRRCDHEQIVYEVEDVNMAHRVAFSHWLVCLGCRARVAFVQAAPSLDH